jgi:predicted ATPase
MSQIPHTNIRRLKVKNYRSLADIDIALTPLTVFVGKNGTGKSNVIDVLRFVRDALVDGFLLAVFRRGGMKSLRCWFAEESEDVSIELYLEGPEFKAQYGLTFGNSKESEYEIKGERFFVGGNEQELFFEVVEGKLVSIPERINGHPMRLPDNSKPRTISKSACYLPQLALMSPCVAAVRDFLAKMSFYDLLPHRLREPQKNGHPFPLAETGENLASALRELQRRKRDYLITQALEVAVEGTRGYSIVPVGQHLVTNLHYAFVNGGSMRVQSELGDEAYGTIRILGILTALYQERFPSPLIIEEPEKGLYPRALAVCSDVLQEGAFSYQVLVTTHSPDLIDHFPVDSFLVVEKDIKAGVTKIGPIIANQRTSIEKRLFSTGEIMQMEGLQREPEREEAT